MSKEQDKLDAINYEIDAEIKDIQDKIEDISASAGIPFCLTAYQTVLDRLLQIKNGDFSNLKSIFSFYENKINKLKEQNDALEAELWYLRK